MLGAAMVWRQGQSYSQDLRARVLAAIDGGMAARLAASVFPGERVVHLQGADPAAPDRGGERQLAARSPAAQTDLGARGGPGGPYRSPSGCHPGGAANLAGGRACCAIEQRGDVVGGRPPRLV